MTVIDEKEKRRIQAYIRGRKGTWQFLVSKKMPIEDEQFFKLLAYACKYGFGVKVMERDGVAMFKLVNEERRLKIMPEIKATFYADDTPVDFYVKVTEETE